MIEKYLGHYMGRLLIQAMIISLLIGIIGLGLTSFLGFIRDVILPLLAWIGKPCP